MSTWPDLQPGQRAYLEGPYGGFVLDPDSREAVFIAGGIGVTPIVSILRSRRDRQDDRPFVLIYSNTESDIAFRDEIDELVGALDLVIIHLLEDAPDHWDGEEGYPDEKLLRRRLPADYRNFEYFICGPDPMMDAAETALRDLGRSWRQIYTERFQIV